MSKIAIDGTALYGRFGGVEYALSSLLGALGEIDQENHYVVYVPRDAPAPVVQNARWRWAQLPFAGANKLRRIAWQQRELPRLLQCDSCDLLHAPTYVCPLSCPVPIVLGVYDLIALTHPQFATRANRLHYGTLLPRCLKGAREIIVPTQAIKTDVEKYAPDAKTHVVPLGVENDFRRAVNEDEREIMRRRYSLPDDFILFVGNHEPKKNLASLLRALPFVPGAPPLVVVGGVHSWRGYAPQTNARVLDLGYVPRRDLPGLYVMCRAFVFPTLAEGFGLPILEALACGAPVVAGQAAPLPDLEKVALLCDAQRPADIARQLRRVLLDGELSAELSRNGREYARPFTWRRSAEMTLRVYDAALKSK